MVSVPVVPELVVVSLEEMVVAVAALERKASVKAMWVCRKEGGGPVVAVG